MTRETSDNARQVPLREPTVPLYRILKFEGLAESGGAAKQYIADGRVRVNGETETRKRRQIASGDRIDFEAVQLLMVDG